MKLVTYDKGTGPHAGVLMDDRVLDVSTLLGLRGPVRDVRALLELPEAPLDRLRSTLASMVGGVGGAGGSGIELSRVRLCAPILQPPTVRDFFAFEDHASVGGTRKLSEAWYRLPIFYFSNPLCVYGPGEGVPYPSASERFDYELEIAAVIGREGRDVAGSEGLSHIVGFTILNDWSARDLQFDEMQCWLGPAKGKDAATSLGPWIVTTDELAPRLRDGRLHVRCVVRVNGEVWMDGNSGAMHHTWGSFVERASKDSRVVPGDVFGSGTVGGGTIGEAIKKGFVGARYLKPGDVVEMEVEALGVLRNTVTPKVSPDAAYPFKAPPPSSFDAPL